MNYDAVNLSKADLRHGGAFIKRVMQQYQIPFVSSNIVYAGDGKQFIQSYLVLERIWDKDKNIKIAILGVCPEQQSLFTSSLNEPGLMSIDPHIALQNLLTIIKNNVDFVVLLSNLGFEKSLSIIDQLKGIDLVIASGDTTKQIKKLPNGTIISSAGYEGKYLGHVQFSNINSKFKYSASENIPLDQHIADDQGLQRVISEYDKAIAADN